MDGRAHLVLIDLERVRGNVESISAKCGVDLIAVVKADGYGVGAREVAEAVGDIVSGFCVFRLEEAREARLFEIGRKPILSLGPSDGIDVGEFLAYGVRPAVWTIEEARRLRAARPVLSVDTGMKRFACDPKDVPTVIAGGEIDEAFTHATRMEHVDLLKAAVAGHKLRLHAAASALWDEPAARLDAIRPGMAMYRGAARITSRLVEVHESRGPAGYSGFVAKRSGVIVRGYSNGLRLGPCVINGARRRFLEVGMQSAYVEIGEGDGVGDEVVMLGDGLSEAEVAADWGCSEQQVLTNLARIGERKYR